MRSPARCCSDGGQLSLYNYSYGDSSPCVSYWGMNVIHPQMVNCCYWPSGTFMQPPLPHCYVNCAFTPVTPSYYDASYEPSLSPSATSATSTCTNIGSVWEQKIELTHVMEQPVREQVSKNNPWSFSLITPHFPLPGWQPLPYGLERFWMSAFLWLFLDLYERGHLWTLRPTQAPPKDDHTGQPWCMFVHSAKVRFNCLDANHGWTSMLGKSIFWFRMMYDRSDGLVKGEVLFKLYGQKCEKCNTQRFETALWYPEEIANALWHLYFKVGEKIYGRPINRITKGLRQGKPLRPHKPELCQACNEGICRMGDKKSQPKN